jgi:hypothetical protein
MGLVLVTLRDYNFGLLIGIFFIFWVFLGNFITPPLHPLSPLVLAFYLGTSGAGLLGVLLFFPYLGIFYKWLGVSGIGLV